MKYYPVPFSAREETPFIFGLYVREMLWIGAGIIVGLVIALIIFVPIGAKLQYLILCLPVMIPFVGLSFYLARKRVKEDDRYETLDRHLIKKLKYKYRPHTYLNFRRED
ncbi:PrgI family protein [Desulfotomaculum arcticum]|uniref:PrgI family protein n=1 Tax=Desulfotruncus arcticus DSM 17038 TaxID=1121424 RepID=A0A1I2Z9E8_9FIRM|nr:PrgI family protein [Desulfotruncus arcticus]SFH34414.1 PrgI family protein [Desulfotomaculum arcticum] [Desulfotruncus arcticus DSM 17038]